MGQAKSTSRWHALIALVVLAPLALAPIFFLERQPRENPLALLERLDRLVSGLPEPVKKDLLARLNLRNGQLTLLSYDQMKQLADRLQEEQARPVPPEPQQWKNRIEAWAESLEPKQPIPVELRGVGITENVGADLPLDLVFRDENNREVTLGSFFHSGVPVILTLNYSNCPQLCHVQLNQFVETMRNHKILPGPTFKIVTVSIDPEESTARAKNARRNYLLDLEAADADWHFLTSPKEENIKTLARIVGFGYRYDPIRKDYAHSSSLIFCTPEGKVSQYYQGINYQGRELQQRIADAAAGKQYLSLVEDNPFNCKVYDGSQPYVQLAGRMMKTGAAIAAVILVVVLTILWMIPSKKPEVLPPLAGG